ncbi:MAG TPA: hypothetical protein VGP64_01315 [Polyangia bacterium]|jgi:hypothetical protein
MVSIGRAAIVLAVLSQVGCVLYDRHVALIAPEARGAPDACTPGNPVVAVKFVDGRARRGPIGAVRNGFYMAMSDVVTSDDLGAWVTRGMSNGLRRAGACVASVRQFEPPSPNVTQVTIAGAITSAWCDAYFSYWGDVTLDVNVVTPSGQSFRKTYSGHGTGGMNVAASEESFAQVLNLALADAVSRIIRDVNSMPLASPPPPPTVGDAGHSSTRAGRVSARRTKPAGHAGSSSG